MKYLIQLSLLVTFNAQMTFAASCHMKMLEIVSMDFKTNWRDSAITNNIRHLKEVKFVKGGVSYKGLKNLIGKDSQTCWVTYYMNQVPLTKGGCPFDRIFETKVYCK